jgi:hypothetical protein
MSYNIIPKNIFQFNIHFSLKDIKNINNKNNIPYISHSLYNFLLEIKKQIDEIELSNKDIIDTIVKIINPYEFLYTNVPNFEISVSKVKTISPILFDLIEMNQICVLNDFFSLNNSLKFGIFSSENTSIEYFINMVREEHNDLQYFYSVNNLFDLYKSISSNNLLYNCFFMEIDNNLYNSNLYLFYLLLYLLSIIKNQEKGGLTIIKISYLFNKSIIDIVYILSCIYDKIQLIKPNVNNIVYSELYLVCKNKLVSPLIENNNNEKNSIHEDYSYLCEIEKNIHLLFLILTNDNVENIYIQSIIQLNDKIDCLPYFFINKLEELNSIYGQQQLEILDQIINIYKNKLRNDKLEIIKKNNIQKCVQWCEKNQIPHNKFFDKNIFLCNSIIDNNDTLSSNEIE